MRSTLLWGLLGLSAAACQVIGEGAVSAQSQTAKPDPVAVGYEIFNREWMPGDPPATAATGSGRFITIRPVSPATTREAAAALARSARTLRS